MKILSKKLTPENFIDYIAKLQLPFWRKVDKLVFHHTSTPAELWHGSDSILHYYNLYKSRGWKTGPHIFIAPDGIWLFTPISKQGTHAGEEGNKNSIGIEVVGRYFEGPPTDDTLCKYIAVVTDSLKEKFNIGGDKIFNHNDYKNTDFCTPFITEEWLRINLQQHIEFVLQKRGNAKHANELS